MTRQTTSANGRKLDENTIAALVDEVDESRLVTSLASMVAMPSVNPFDDNVTESCRELEFADFYQDQMTTLGLQTDRREVVAGRPNVFGRIIGHTRKSEHRKCVMLAGHLDTVGVEGYPAPFDPVVRDGRLYGRGSCDMKAALAAYIEVARILQNHDIRLRGDLVIAGVVDEEHGMIGSKDISENGPIPDLAIVGEPTELKVCHTHKGQLCMHIRTFGRACHSSVPETGINAISLMADVIKGIECYADDLATRPGHPICGHARVNPGVIQGGTISSAVPDYCELEVDRRYLPGETPESITAEYRDILENISRQNPDFRYEIGQPLVHNAALDTPAESEVVSTIASAFEAVQGRPADIGVFPAATDAPHFLCPAVVCGPGSIYQAHTVDEYVTIDELTASARIYLRAVLRLLG